jgi:hypothetical protein
MNSFLLINLRPTGQTTGSSRRQVQARFPASIGPDGESTM